MSQVRQELAVREREIRDKQVQNIKTALGALSVAEAPNDGANQLRWSYDVLRQVRRVLCGNFQEQVQDLHD